MKSNLHPRKTFALLSCVALLASPMLAQSSSVDQGRNRTSHPPVSSEATVNTDARTPSPTAGTPVNRDRIPDRAAERVDRTTDRMTQRGASDLTRGDQRLLKKIAKANEYEIALSRQAATRSSNTQVRTFAEMLVREHEKVGNELTTFAARRGVMIPPAGDRYRDDLMGLANETGNDYDEAYLDDMVDAHEDAIELFEDAAESDDAEIAGFATKHLPSLRDHLQRARQLLDAIDD